eukprot:CAMPEP_0205936172 /NCGR_PEP_ID=MMETSP1325-20131115/40915_1 /ASSEMBLY_ACC=CAM_ASM_000708 /TAXON_ID=236786 /ORGANISM="Florenciella sp., Strain RCC1007" /LENGTH=66 /DNA_ID=CAMNT_0053306311 /DNA_START=39 /DNA_END=236 /DNA_ORIENTATION=+
MATQGLYSESMWLYPFNVNSNKCKPCYCKSDGRLTCPRFLGEIGGILLLSQKDIKTIESGTFDGLD